jgi:hypothetical protein
MKRLFLVVAAAALLTACTQQTEGSPARGTTVTQTVTSTAQTTTPEPTGEVEALPCDAPHMEAVLAPGEGGGEAWTTAIVVTNLGPDDCRLEGVSWLDLYGDDAGPLEPKQVTDDSVPPDLVILDAGDQAAMAISYPTTSDPAQAAVCDTGATSAEFLLPCDERPLEARHQDPAMVLPPMCGAVEITSWFSGGAPGVPS